MAKINKIKIRETGEVYDIEATNEYIGLNDSGNVEVHSTGTNTKGDPKKVNIVAAGDIQIKPGDDSTIQLDVENDTTNPNDVSIKTCNGTYPKSKRVVRTKLNTAEIILDTQNANTDEFSQDEMHIKLRCDKKNNPIYGKLHARAWDIRCHDHGGIALQPCGTDGEVENKIKFESSRTSPLTKPATFSDEGGKGLEFGTFNNEHSSLFTKDYRFNVNGNVFAVDRKDPVEINEKFDYPTQSDDFKDVLPKSSYENLYNITWGDIIAATYAMKYNCTFSDALDIVKSVIREAHPQAE